MNKPTIKRIHVNQHIIKSNAKNGTNDPVFTVKNRGKTYTADRVKIRGESTLVYSPDNPLSCGARVWIETKSMVVTETDSRVIPEGMFGYTRREFS
jgi:hypothetical protein